MMNFGKRSQFAFEAICWIKFEFEGLINTIYIFFLCQWKAVITECSRKLLEIIFVFKRYDETFLFCTKICVSELIIHLSRGRIPVLFNFFYQSFYFLNDVAGTKGRAPIPLTRNTTVTPGKAKTTVGTETSTLLPAKNTALPAWAVHHVHPPRRPGPRPLHPPSEASVTTSATQRSTTWPSRWNNTGLARSWDMLAATRGRLRRRRGSTSRTDRPVLPTRLLLRRFRGVGLSEGTGFSAEDRALWDLVTNVRRRGALGLRSVGVRLLPTVSFPSVPPNFPVNPHCYEENSDHNNF